MGRRFQIAESFPNGFWFWMHDFSRIGGWSWTDVCAGRLVQKIGCLAKIKVSPKVSHFLSGGRFGQKSNKSRREGRRAVMSRNEYQKNEIGSWKYRRNPAILCCFWIFWSRIPRFDKRQTNVRFLRSVCPIRACWLPFTRERKVKVSTSSDIVIVVRILRKQICYTTSFVHLDPKRSREVRTMREKRFE
jgi:hypothetical protein